MFTMPPAPKSLREVERKAPQKPLSELAAGDVRIVPLGGVEEVGRNMIAVEYNGDIIVSDCGFQFEDEDTPGIDYTLPNTSYLEANKHKIRAIFITHGHLDHIGGIPYIMDRIGNPPIYTQYVTSLMIKKRQEEFPHLAPLGLNIIEAGQRIKIGNTYVGTFPVTHSIPDSMGIAIETVHGRVVISGDLRLEHEGGVPTEKEKKNWSGVGKEKNLILISDSTNAEQQDFSVPENRVYETIEGIIKNTKGRLIIGTFASQFERMIHIIMLAEKYGKKVVAEGRSVKTNLDIAQYAKLLTPKPDTFIQGQDISSYPPDKILIIATGAQGEENAALMRIATKRHKFITFNERDTIMLSSSVIPGNEVSVQRLKDNLYRYNPTIIHYRTSDVHTSGHGNIGELIWIREQVKPKFFMPAYGYHSMLRCHANAQIASGFPEENAIVPDNGMAIDIIGGTKLHIQKDAVPSEPVAVDGFSVGNVQEAVVRDRKTLAQEGMFVIIATVDPKTGKLRKSPDIISRGFIYLRENQETLQQARIIIKKTIEDTTRNMHPVNFDYVKNNVTDAVARFLFEKTNKRPLVIPVILGL